MRVSLMVEGQEGVTWEQWVEIARACERAGLEGLFRSDHYTGFLRDGLNGSLDAWVTLSALAAVTERIQLGTLVSPATFRHPSVLARMVATASHVSGGRVELGLGAGWNESEHIQHGFRFARTSDRLALLAEQLEIIRLSWGDDRFDFSGPVYDLRDALPLPKPLGSVNVIVGGSAKPGTVEPAARFADEYNLVLVSPEDARRGRRAIEEACARIGRPPLTVSLMTRCIVGENRASLQRRRSLVAELTGGTQRDAGEETIEGTVDEVVEKIRTYEDAGVERIMLQHLLHDDHDMVELLGREVVPQVS